MNRLTLRQAREKRDMTQQQLATLAELKQGQISEIETGQVIQPEIGTMSKLARALDMDAFLSARDGLVFEERAS